VSWFVLNDIEQLVSRAGRLARGRSLVLPVGEGAPRRAEFDQNWVRNRPFRPNVVSPNPRLRHAAVGPFARGRPVVRCPYEVGRSTESVRRLGGRERGEGVSNEGCRICLGGALLAAAIAVTLPARPAAAAVPTLVPYGYVNVEANDIAADAKRKVVWASVPIGASSMANSIVDINSTTGAIGTPIAVGENPQTLALSDDASTMYVTFSTASIAQIDLATRTVLRTFSLGFVNGQFPQPGDIAVSPGDLSTLVVAKQASDRSFDSASGAPANVAAVVLNVTSVSATAGSYVTAYPSDVAQPTVSNLNFTAGKTVPNLVIVRVPANGRINIVDEVGFTHLIADVMGYYTTLKTPTESGRFQQYSPFRFYDSRSSSPFPSPGKSPQGSGLILGSTSYSALALNITVTQPEGPGFVTVFPYPGTVPDASNLNFEAGQTVANAALSCRPGRSSRSTTAVERHTSSWMFSAYLPSQIGSAGIDSCASDAPIG
jgi:hypothetical protein